jgi:RNA polymerase sigma-70 factor (ECF subfamily)
MLYEFDHQQLASFTSTNTATDEQLMACIQARDEAALTTLYRRHNAVLRTVVARVVHHDQDVDDVLQEVLLELWNRADHYDQAKGKALGWLVTLARRRAIDRIRRRQAYSRAEERARLETETQPDLNTYHGADEDAQDADRAEIFRRILATLPDAQREALQLAYYSGLSQREIAAKTGIPLGTIKTRLELGVRKVRTAILSMGGAEEWTVAHA